jgi:hypothetical protein
VCRERMIVSEGVEVVGKGMEVMGMENEGGWDVSLIDINYGFLKI